MLSSTESAVSATAAATDTVGTYVLMAWLPDRPRNTTDRHASSFIISSFKVRAKVRESALRPPCG